MQETGKGRGRGRGRGRGGGRGRGRGSAGIGERRRKVQRREEWGGGSLKSVEIIGLFFYPKIIYIHRPLFHVI